MKNDQLTSQPRSASWLTKPEWLRWIAHEIGLVEPEYLGAVQALLATFPPGWIEEQSRLIVSTPQPETRGPKLGACSCRATSHAPEASAFNMLIRRIRAEFVGIALLLIAVIGSVHEQEVGVG